MNFHFQNSNFIAWFQASATKYIRYALLWEITQRIVVIIYRRLGQKAFEDRTERLSPKLQWIITNIRCVISQKTADPSFFFFRSSSVKKKDYWIISDSLLIGKCCMLKSSGIFKVFNWDTFTVWTTLKVGGTTYFSLLRRRAKSRGFDSRLFHWNFS